MFGFLLQCLEEFEAMWIYSSILVISGFSGLTLSCRIVIRPPRPPAKPSPSSPPPDTTRPSSCRCGVSSVTINRIVGGEPARKNEFPWQVSLVSKFGSRPRCGGSLLSSTTVLTAAHCELPVFLMRVVLGDHDVTASDGEIVVTPAQWINHPQYDRFTNNNDFAIIRLSSSVTFSSFITPVCLPSTTQNYEQREAIVTGWGTLYSSGPQPDVLHKVGVSTITNTQCTTNTLYSPSDLTTSMLCARGDGKDSCQGDSGGPLIAPEGGGRYFSVIGVVSFGYGCALPNAPGVYSRVSAVVGWIQANTQGVTCQPP